MHEAVARVVGFANVRSNGAPNADMVSAPLPFPVLTLIDRVACARLRRGQLDTQ
jgi:hypothetical protein